MDDNVKDDFENIPTTVKEKNPGRVEAGKRLAERNKENKLSNNNNYLYIGIGVGFALLVLLKSSTSPPPPPPVSGKIQPSEIKEVFDEDMFNL